MPNHDGLVVIQFCIGPLFENQVDDVLRPCPRETGTKGMHKQSNNVRIQRVNTMLDEFCWEALLILVTLLAFLMSLKEKI